MKWRVDRERPVPKPKEGWGWDVERAVALDLVRGRDTKRVLVVGYVANAPTTSARMAALPYLDMDEPPKRLLVRHDGQVAIVE